MNSPSDASEGNSPAKLRFKKKKSRKQKKPVASSGNANSVNSNTDTSAYNDLIDTMVQNDKASADEKSIEFYRLKIKKFLSPYTTSGNVYEWILVLISIASCLQYIITQYLNDYGLYPKILDTLEIIWTCAIMVDLFLLIWLSDHKIERIQR
jgi:hypothetical protein